MGRKQRKKKTTLELISESDAVIRANKLLVEWINASAEGYMAYIAHLP